MGTYPVWIYRQCVRHQPSPDNNNAFSSSVIFGQQSFGLGNATYRTLNHQRSLRPRAEQTSEFRVLLDIARHELTFGDHLQPVFTRVL